MKTQIKYISERGSAFDTREEAIEHDKALPVIIDTYKNDLERMEGGLKTFGGQLVTEEMKENWRAAITEYEAKWELAKASLIDGDVKDNYTIAAMDSGNPHDNRLDVYITRGNARIKIAGYDALPQKITMTGVRRIQWEEFRLLLTSPLEKSPVTAK